MANRISILVLAFLLANQFSEALVDRSLTVNKGQSGFFSLNADDLMNEDDLRTEPDQPNTKLPAVGNLTIPAPDRIYGISVDPNKALEPRSIFQRIHDAIAAIGVYFIMMVYNTITTYLLSYRQLLRIFKNIPEDNDGIADIEPAIRYAAS